MEILPTPTALEPLDPGPTRNARLGNRLVVCCVNHSVLRSISAFALANLIVSTRCRRSVPITVKTMSGSCMNPVKPKKAPEPKGSRAFVTFMWRSLYERWLIYESQGRDRVANGRDVPNQYRRSSQFSPYPHY